MSYEVYKNFYNIREIVENPKNQDFYHEELGGKIKTCFNMIADSNRYNPKNAVWFDLKTNWNLLRNRNYDEILVNIQNWLIDSDFTRFKTWEGKNGYMNPTITALDEEAAEYEVVNAMGSYMEDY